MYVLDLNGLSVQTFTSHKEISADLCVATGSFNSHKAGLGLEASVVCCCNNVAVGQPRKMPLVSYRWNNAELVILITILV